MTPYRKFLIFLHLLFNKSVIISSSRSLIAEAAEEAAESLKKLNLSSQDDSSDTECENDNLPLDPESAIEIMIAQQSEELLRVRAALKKTCTKDELIKLLAYNDSAPVDGFDNLLDRCADFLTFGALYNCQKCSKGDMIFTKHGYTCNGMIDEWVKCGNQEKEPMRLKCFIPSSLEDNNFFLTCEQKISTRAVRPKVLRDEDEASTSSKYQPTTSSTLKRVASIKFKEGTVVDPRSKLVDTTHVYKYKDTLFESVLCLIDIQKDRNSYFKLQVLETDRDQSKIGYFLFTSWGRIGTDIGSSKVEDFSSPIDACRKFEKLFEEKTSNSWKTRGKFIRQPNKFYPVEVTYNEGIKTNTTTASKLSASVEELMKLLFNVQNMTRTMKSFKLDLDKMPLGKLSVQQLKLARLALDELKQAVDEKDESKLIGLSNKFYTLVPHSFGLFKARVIETNADIVKKHEMIDSLMDIQKAYGIMLKTTPSNDVNSFDAYYKRLNAEITAVDPKSRGYELIERYVANTQVHGIKLKVLEVFMVKRNGEKERYEKYKKLDNRMLLWHGSRLTNFTSILSNGLTIGAVANGSMFGRGIYFADMVSKSSQYCAPTPPDNIGLLALSEVALGNIHELNQGMNLNQPPAGKDSVKGVGRTQPNLKYAHKRKDGVVIPLGRPYKEGQQAAATRSLIHNEYIVYNEAQVNLQYLVKLQIG